MICIVDYRQSNVGPVVNAIKQCGRDAIVSNSKQDILDATSIVLPNSMDFGDAIDSLHDLRLFDLIKEEVTKGKPLLGISLGSHLLVKSCEASKLNGLDLLKGNITRLPLSKKEPLPHIGWNSLQKVKDSNLINNCGEFFFNHRFYLDNMEELTVTTTLYGLKFSSVIQQENIVGVQFLPEKSGINGLTFLSNYLEGL